MSAAVPAPVGTDPGVLLDLMLATVLFAFVALTGVEVLRGLSADALRLAQRHAAQAQLRVAAARLRSDALSASAVWKPPAGCGDAVAFLQRDAAGARFALYLLRGGALVHASGPAPLDPCDPGLVTEPIVTAVSDFRVQTFAAGELPTHRDGVSGTADDELLQPSGIVAVAADAHVRDVDGAPIPSGNAVVEAVIDAAPALTVVDLVAGNRPNGFAQVLTYACGGRCAANGPFPELRGAAVTTCSAAVTFANTPQYYVPASFVLVDAGGSQPQVRVTSYWVTGAYDFAFDGRLAARRTWTPAVWPPGGAVLSDPYPIDYTRSALAAAAPAQIAADVGAAQAYAAELGACAALANDATFDDR
jgi:hypothetical protein